MDYSYFFLFIIALIISFGHLDYLRQPNKKIIKLFVIGSLFLFFWFFYQHYRNIQRENKRREDPNNTTFRNKAVDLGIWLSQHPICYA
jgi:hypothetical protein